MERDNKIKYEDLIMKYVMTLFAESGLKFLGIPGEVKTHTTTEQIELKIENLATDYTFLMEDGSYVHLEFQTTNKGKQDLRRFRVYEANLSYTKQADVRTYVIYTNGIKNPNNVLECGDNVYKVNVISMAKKNADDIIDNIEQKLNRNEEITEQDLVALVFTPVMSSIDSIKNRIKRAVEITKQVDNNDIDKFQAILITFANKFLNDKELDEIKEVLKMTRLGALLYEDTIEEVEEKYIVTGIISLDKNMNIEEK